jgi:hypothetical protein
MVAPAGNDMTAMPNEPASRAKFLFAQGVAPVKAELTLADSNRAAPNVPEIVLNPEIRESHTYPRTAAVGMLASLFTTAFEGSLFVPQLDIPSAKPRATQAAIPRRPRPHRECFPLSMD